MNFLVNFVDVCKSCSARVIDNVVRRLFNSDKIRGSYSRPTNVFGATFWRHCAL